MRVGLFHLADIAGGNSAFVFLLPEITVAFNLDDTPFRKEVDHRHADPVQTARCLIGTLTELPAEFQNCHHPFQGRLFQVGVDLDGDPAAVVFDGNRTVAVDRYRNRVGESGQRLINRIVNDFGNQVVKPAGSGIADVHSRPNPDMFAVAQML